jgi:hypothetical protein
MRTKNCKVHWKQCASIEEGIRTHIPFRTDTSATLKERYKGCPTIGFPELIEDKDPWHVALETRQRPHQVLSI